MPVYSPFSVFSGRTQPTRPPPQQHHGHYDPNQPRVPAGHSDGGQWTIEDRGQISAQRGEPTVLSDEPTVLSDAIPDNDWKPGAQYAQNRRGGRVGSIQLSPGQSVRLAIAEGRAQEALRKIHEREPGWRPRASLYQSAEGRVLAAEAKAREAQARLREFYREAMLPGRFVCEWIVARGPGRDFLPIERHEINRIGYTYGCHTCGTKDPGTGG